VLAGYLGVVCGTHLLYPLRLLYRRRNGFMPIGLKPHLLRIPAFFDPAPLLYPTLLPIFVACSLTPLNPKILLANLILSIAAIPSQVVPLDYLGSGYNLFHWFLTVIPLLLARKSTLGIASNSCGDAPILLDQFDTEKFSVLYPLHQALLPALGYLTTTSLLPAELQLLSISLINLLFFSSSAQATILTALLWVGGLLVFLLCGDILRWGVALARVPSWRFRHSHKPRRGGNVLLVAIDDYFHGRLRKWRLISAVHDSSDSEVCMDAGAETTQNTRLERLSVEIPGGAEGTQDSGPKLPTSAVDEARQSGIPGLQNSRDPSATQMRRYRRHTLLSYVASPQGAPLLQRTTLVPPSRPSPSRPRSFLSMTYAQATVVKWCYAAYVYLVALLVIAIPIRIAISNWALQGHEPVGWALGYLFGNIPIFRSTALDLHLQSWIRLPLSIEPDQNWEYSPWSQYLHHIVAANTRLVICVYCLGILAIGLCIVFRLTAFVEVDTRRKVFHGMMVAMFLPSILVDPAFAALALSLALAVFLLLDLFRASQLPPLSRPLTHFLAPYVDGRDHRGPVIVSHIFLLIGCAIPLWLSLAAVDRTGAPPWEGWEIPTRDLSMVSGVVCVGMGDAAASLFGRRFGRRRWGWGGGKTLEGSFAFAVAVVLGLLIAKLGIRFGGWGTDSSGNEGWLMVLSKSTAAALGASFTEAVLTGGNDNVIVPVVLWLLIRGLAI
jgi:dolichol kinase